MILEQEGVYGYCELDALDIDLVTLDTDILSLEMPEFFRSFYLVCRILSLIGSAVLLHSQTFLNPPLHSEWPKLWSFGHSECNRVKINGYTFRGNSSAIILLPSRKELAFYGKN